jgi:hypothetical protein
MLVGSGRAVSSKESSFWVVILGLILTSAGTGDAISICFGVVAEAEAFRGLEGFSAWTGVFAIDFAGLAGLPVWYFR